MRRHVFTLENALAAGLCAVVLLLIIVTSDAAPEWIYQGF